MINLQITGGHTTILPIRNELLTLFYRGQDLHILYIHTYILEVTYEERDGDGDGDGD